MALKNVNIANQSTGAQAYTSSPGSYTAAQINGAFSNSSTAPPTNPLSITQGDTIEMDCYEGQSMFSVEFRADPNDVFIPGNTGEQASGTDTNNGSGQTWATLPVSGTWTVTSANTGTYPIKIVQRTFTDPKASLVTNTKYLWFTVVSSGSAPTSFTTQPVWNSGNANSGATASLSTSPVANGSPAPTYSYSESSSLLSINSSSGAITWDSANTSTSSRTATVTCTATNASGSFNTNRTVTQLGGPGVSGAYAYSQEVSSGGTESPSGSPTFTGTAGTWAVTSAGGSSTNGATINTSNGTITWASNSGSSARSVTVYRQVTRNGYSRWLTVGTASQEGSGGSGGGTSSTITQSQTYSTVRTEGNNYIQTASNGAVRTIFDISSSASSGTESVTNAINSNSHTISYNPGSTGTYSFTVRRRDQSAVYDPFAEFYLWQTDTTTLYTYTITVNPSAPSADTSVTVSQSFTSGTTASATVSGSGGSGGTTTYILKTSSATPAAGDAAWQSSNSYTGLTRNVTYYGWTKRSNVSGNAISSVGSKTMAYNTGSTAGFVSNSSSTTNNLIELSGSESTFLVKFRLLSSTSQYRLVNGGSVARDWFTPNSTEQSSSGSNVSVTNRGAGTYTLQSRRPVANGGNGSTTTNVDTVAVTTPVSGNINSTAVVVPGGTVSITGSVVNLSTGTNINWTVKRNDTNATINSGTVTTTEDNESIATSVAAPNNGSTSIGYTLSWSGGSFSGSATTTTTILQGTISYATKNAASGSVAVSASGNYSSIGTWTENSSATTINSSGTLTWLHNEGSASRTSTVGATISLSGVSRTISTVASQQGGATIGLSYANVNSNITTQGDSTTGTYSSVSYAKLSGDAAGTVNSSTGVVTWSSVNEGTADRSITVRATASRNGDTDTVDATATQLGGASVSGFSYATKNAAAGSVNATITTTGSVSYARVSGSTACTVNSSTGQITWTLNEGTGSRTATIRATVTRNGDTDTADAVATQQGGAAITSFSYGTKNAVAGSVNVTIAGTYSSISYARVSGSTACTVNSSTGQITWTANEGTGSRTATIRATVSRNGDTDTSDVVATQQGGASVSLSYSNIAASGGTQNASPGGTYSSISYAKQSGDANASVNTTTGAVTWPLNEAASSRSCVVRATASRNGDVDTVDATATQLAGSSITSFSYATKNATSGTVNPSIAGTYSSISYSKVSGSSAATVNTTTGAVTWTLNEGTGSRSCVVRATVSNNGDADTADATSTQQGGTSHTLSYVDKNSRSGSVSPTVSGTYTSISYSKLSGDSQGSVNASTGAVTWASNNESTSSRSITVRSVSTRNGDSDTVDATCTQLGGASVSLTGATRNAAAGTSTPSISGTYSAVSYSKVSGSSAATVNTSTGVVTWTANEGTASRSCVIRATATRNGDTNTADATMTQQGGASVALSYGNINANVLTQSPTVSGTYSSISYSEVGTQNNASVNSSTGVVSWISANPSTSSRSITVRATVSRNGDTDTVDATQTQLGGANVSLSYGTKNATSGDQSPIVSGTYTSVSYSKVSGSSAASVNTSTGIVTWTHNESSSSRSCVVRATATRNGDTATSDATATQQGGASATLSYADKNSRSGDVSPTISGTYTTLSYSKVSGDSQGSVNSSTGVVTWASNNESTASRSITVRATVTRNGDSDTIDATCTQLGGASVSLSYSNVNANITTQVDTTGGTYSSVSYSKLSGDAAGTVNSSTGTVTWSGTNEGTSARSISVRATATRNGDTNTADATATQNGGATVSLSYVNKSAASGTVNATIGGTHDSISFAKISGDAAATVNTSTGAVTWTANEATANRSCVVRATASRNGDTDTVDATSTQLGGASVSLSYSNLSSGTTTRSPTVSGTYDTISYAKQSGDAAGSVNSSTGVVTFSSANETGSDRTITVRATVTRNSDTDTFDATCKQFAGTNGSFSYGTKNAAAGGISPSITGTYSGVTFSKLSGSSAATVNTSTGEVTWSINEGTSERSCVVRGVFTQSDDSDTVDVNCTQQGGATITLSYASVNPNITTQSDSTGGVQDTVTYTKISGDAAGGVNSSTGTVTWSGTNTSTNSRSITVRATATRNGDTDTVDATATQLGNVSGTLSYTTKNAAAGTVSPTVGGVYSTVSYSKVSGSSAGTVNTSTGVVTWTANEGTADRSVLVRGTFSRNGQTITVDATSLQQGGASISSYSYANKTAPAGTVSPSITSTGTLSYSKVSGSSAATINSSTGVVTWTGNAGSQRSAVFRVTATRNGDTDTLDATATQLAPSTLTASIGSVGSTTPLEGTSDALTGSATLDAGVTITSWTWSSTGPITLSSTSSQNTTATFTDVTVDTAGSVTLDVVDSLGRTDSVTQNFTILLDNQAPVAVLTAPASGEEGDPVNVSGAGSSDADGHSLTYAYTATDGTNSFNRAASSTATWSFTPTVAGTYTVTLTVNDGYASVNAQKDVIVTEVNNPPTSSAGEYGIEIIKANGDVSLNGNELLIRYAGNLDVSSGSGSTNVTVPEAATEILPIGSGAANSSSASGVEYTVTGTTTKTVSVTDNGSASEVGLFIFK